MFCSNCKNEIDEKAKFCPYCGEKIVLAQENQAVFPKESEFKNKETNFQIYHEEKNIKTESIHSITSKKRKAKTKYIIIASVFLCIVTIIFSFVFYYNSNGYRIKKATDLIIWHKSYNEALRLVQDIDTREGEAIREYIVVVIEKRQAIADGFKQTYLEESGEAVDEFISALDEYTESRLYRYLPEQLKQQYESTVEKNESLLNYLKDIPSYIINAQKVLLNETIRNTGRDFTLNEMQANIDTSKTALKELEHVNYFTSMDWECCGEYTKYFIETLDTLKSEINSEITSEEEFIEATLNKGFGMSESIYNSYYEENPIEDFYYLPYPLESIYNSDDINKNAWDLYYTLERGMYVYYISNIYVY